MMHQILQIHSLINAEESKTLKKIILRVTPFHKLHSRTSSLDFGTVD